MAALALTAETPEVKENAKSIFEAQRLAIYIRTDKLFAGLMAVQWAGAVVAACCLSPLTWAGTVSQVHPHVWAAIFLGGLLSIFPICLALIYPGRMTTRQVIAVSQLLMSALLIHVTGGRTETHFHIFGSLAFLAFYRDWRVLASATLVTATDHLLRGIYWPQSVYGLAVASPWLTVEHAGWVAFEDVFLLISCRQSLREMSQISLRQSQLQSAERVLIHSNETLETQVEQRTQELSEALQEHRNVMETVPDILFRLDMSGRLVQWNRKMETVTGLTPEELQGKSALDLFAEDEKCVIAQAIAQAFCSGYTAVEGSLLGTNGVAALHQFSGVPLQNTAGELIGLTGMGRDITERRHSEIALLESETRYRGLVDHSPEAIIVYSENRFVYANAAAVTLFAASSAEELIGRLIFDFVHADNRSLAQLRAARSQKEGETSPLTEQKYVRLDGEVINVEAVSTGIIYQGKPAGQVLIRDITKRKKAEEKILALNAEMICAYDATIEGWSRALDLRDHETEGHSRRVTEMTLRLAEAVGVPSEELIHVRRGALLHDIGKMGVPDAILLKPGPLDDAEWEIMRRHPELARAMLSPTEFLHPALDIPYCHHEKWDGSGYPCGLHGEEIPLPARLFALVDVWDALTSDRPYRAAWPRGRVLDHLRSLAGTHFDPAIVSVFLRMIEAEALPEVFILPPEPRLAA
jgi:PAS domain S-box-containing protein